MAIVSSKIDGKVMVTLEDGTTVPRKAYVLRRFAEDAKRGEIAKELGVPVQIVFGFTKNLANAHHTPGVGRRNAGNIVNPLTGEEESRPDVIRALVASGKTRKEVAAELGISYQAVYVATKPAKVEVSEAPEAPEAPEAKVAEVAEVPEAPEAPAGGRKKKFFA